MSDVGRNAAGVDLTFSDSAGAALPASGNLATGTFTPTDAPEECALSGGMDPFPAPAPIGPYGTSLSVFTGLSGSSVNGTWSLYLVDDCGLNAGSITGWSLNIAHNPTAVVVSSFTAGRQGKGVALRWRTAVETNLLGFNVFRNGLKVNRYLVQAKGRARGGAYSFLDRTALKARTYTYRLQAVGIDGSKRWRGTARVTPKRTRAVRSLASRATTSLDFVCSLQKNGSLRYVTGLSQCRKKETGVTVSPGPVHTCYQADNSVRQVASQAACLAPGTYLKLPPVNVDAFFCADADGRLTREAAAGNCGASTEVFSQHTNDPPTDIGLSPASIAENQAANTVVGTLSSTDPNVGDTFTYTLVSGTGSTDNGSFNISAASLRSSASFDFETKSSYSIRVRTTDSGGLFFEKVFTVSVTNVNEAPTDIGLSSTAVDENQSVNTTVGTLSSTDQDAGETFTYSLVSGTGSTDNGSFNISGSALRTSASFNYEVKSSYSIRVRTTDSGSLFFEKVFTISVNNVNEPPVNTVPAAQVVNEDTDLVFSSGSGNALSVADVDAFAGSIQTTVSALNGTITPATGSGATITGSGTASAQITGTLTQVNAALSGLKYKGTVNWNSTRGTETLTIQTNDQGNSCTNGPCPALSDTDTVAITVNAVNDPPLAVTQTFGPNAVQANMKRSGQLTLPLASASDPDTGDGGYVASLTTPQANVSATSPVGGTVTITNAATGAFDFDPPPGATGNVTFTYQVCDTGNPGPGVCSSATMITVNVAGPVIWFVNPALGVNGNGNLASPFNNLASADAVDAVSQKIFLYTGTASTGITLNTSEALIGQGVTGPSFDSVMGITPPTGTIARPSIGGTRPTVQGTVTMAGSSTVRGLNISPASGSQGLTASSATGLTVGEVSVTTTNAAAVNLTNSDGTFSFTAINANGGTNGIVWTKTTAATGSFTVTGTGSAGTGGTVQSMTGVGVLLDHASSVSLSYVNVQNGGDDGIRGTAVNGFTLANSTLSANGNAVGENGLDFIGGLTGTASISSSTVTGSAENGLIVTDGSGSLNLTVTGSTFSNTLTSVGNDGIHLDANDTAAITASVTGSTFNHNRGDHLQFATNASATGTNSITFSSNTLTGDRGTTYGGTDLGGGVTISTDASSHTSFTLANNNVQGAVDSALKIDFGTNSTAAGTLSGTISGNTIGTAGTPDSGSSQTNGISATLQGSGTETVAITSNTVRQYSANGINVLTRLGAPTLNATITGNTVANHGTFATNGLLVQAGASSALPDAGLLCAGITSNSITGAGKNDPADPTSTDFRVRQRFSTTVRLPGYAGASTDTTAVINFIKGNNGSTPTGSATTQSPGGGFVGGAACPTPP
jgi:hypothetical protein